MIIQSFSLVMHNVINYKKVFLGKVQKCLVPMDI